MKLRTCTFTALLAAALVSAAYGFAGHILIFSPWNSPGLRVVNIETGAYTNLSSSGVDRPVFSPDGKKVAFVRSNELCYVDNDGNNLVHTGYSYTQGGLGYGYLTWNTDAIYHNDGRGHIFRYSLTTRTATRIYNDSAVGSIAGDTITGYDQGAWYSSDGLKAVMWTYREDDPFHGANVLLRFSSDWTSYTRRFTHIWGHGWLMSRDGQHVVILSLAGGRSHRAWDVYDFERDSLLYYTMGPSIGNLGEISTGQAGYVPNANDYITFASSSDTSNMHAFMQNWKTGAFTEVPQSYLSMVSNKYLIRVGGGWLGPLPSPTATTPEISLNHAILNFAAGGAAQNVTVTNTGSGTLAKVDAAVSPAVSWLAVTVQGSGGNTQTIANTVDASGLGDGSYSTTVTVSGGGALNSAQYTVMLTVGTGIAAPTALEAVVGGATARDVALSWTDNATNETGYSVERRTGGGPWSEIATPAANATSYTDADSDTGTFEYRVRAVRNSSYSSYSNTAGVVVYGLPSVSITSPARGQVITEDTVQIQWGTNLVSNVEILYSLDGEETWIKLNPEGGITTAMAQWGDFTWAVPSVDNNSVILWIHQYQEPGFGAKDTFAIQRANGMAERARAVRGGMQFAMDGGGMLSLRSAGPITLEILLLNGTRAGVLQTEGGHVRYQLPGPGSYLLRARSGSGGQLWRACAVADTR